MQLRIPWNRTEGHLQHFGTKAGAAHAEQQDMRKTSAASIFGRRCELMSVSQLVISYGQPSEPLIFVGIRPEGPVALPQTTYLAFSTPVIYLCFHRAVDLGGQFVGLPADIGGEAPLRRFLNCGQQLVERLRKKLKSLSQ